MRLKLRVYRRTGLLSAEGHVRSASVSATWHSCVPSCMNTGCCFTLSVSRRVSATPSQGISAPSLSAVNQLQPCSHTLMHSTLLGSTDNVLLCASPCIPCRCVPRDPCRMLGSHFASAAASSSVSGVLSSATLTVPTCNEFAGWRTISNMPLKVGFRKPLQQRQEPGTIPACTSDTYF